MAPVLAGATGDDRYLGEGMTPLAALNVAQGAATFTEDPYNPIQSVCALQDADCANPMWLGGLPISWGSRTGGKYETSNSSFE